MSTTLGKYEVVSSRWRCGACRLDQHEHCEQLAHLRDDRWTTCSCDCHKAPATVDELDALIARTSVRRSEVLKATSTRSKSRPCGCGCGDVTKGGTFLPGHDARHRSDLLAVINGEASDGKPEAVARMRELNWGRFLPEAIQAQPLVEVLDEPT